MREASHPTPADAGFSHLPFSSGRTQAYIAPSDQITSSTTGTGLYFFSIFPPVVVSKLIYYVLLPLFNKS